MPAFSALADAPETPRTATPIEDGSKRETRIAAESRQLADIQLADMMACGVLGAIATEN
jgi:hypothetical protein